MGLTLFYNIFRFSYLVIFIGLHLFLMLGIYLEWLREKNALAAGGNAADGIGLPLVSLIIPVHNEALRIKGLLESLEVQDYPNLEIIFVDDRSIDGTGKLITDHIEKTRVGKNIVQKIISLKVNPGGNPKQFALARGLEVSKGDFILFTDADCSMPSGWVSGMVKRLSPGKVGAVIAPVFKKPDIAPSVKKFFHLYQCFEHGIRFVYLSGATGLGAGGGGFGNNLIFKRACLDAIGGYEKIPPSPTEDAALISAVRSAANYKVRSALGNDVHVITQGESNWKSLINQTLRWNNGGLFSPDLLTRFNFAFLMITIGMGIITMPLLPFIPSIWPFPIGVIISMSFNSIANLCLFKKSLPKNSFAFGLNLFFTPAYFTFLTIIGYLGFKPDWKGKQV